MLACGIVTILFLQVYGASVSFRWVKGQDIPESPCPYIFRYNVDTNGNLYGKITVPKPSNDEKVQLEVKFQVPNVVQGENGRIDLLAENPGDSYMNYNLFFPAWINHAPKITSISVNNRQICAGPAFDRIIAPTLTTVTLWNTRTRIITKTPCVNGICENQPPITIDFRPIPPQNSKKVYPRLDNILKALEVYQESGQIKPDIIKIGTTPRPVPRSQNFIPSPRDSATSTKIQKNPFLNGPLNPQLRYPIVPQPQSPRISGTTTSDITFEEPADSSPDNEIMSNMNATNSMMEVSEPKLGKIYPYNDTCGMSPDVNHLIYGGKVISNRQEFPWLVAMFRNKLGLNFLCGGSLISKKHVLTAAHCVKENDKTIPTHQLLIILGRKNLQVWSNDDGAEQVESEELILHPDYRKATADADIAVVVLSKGIRFTPYIKPVCLWMDNNALQNVVNSRGVVVGWGRDENGQVVTFEPKQVTMPIVAQEACLRSNKAFADITSNRSFCAGDRNNSGPCNGDSGGGFVMKIREKWVLRGVVSYSLSKRDRICDLEEYVVFTDASKFTEWILSLIT
ncbi:serine protease gd [Agrilus planipennis]|uniref:Serine protease gd n=1 Tax=Agrilus planipennis TaxID=224129 RepID=A0A1W4XHQ0_AGRPL|nr:serine protease gd [Agrilus planipennis]